MIDPTFKNIFRLSVISFKNGVSNHARLLIGMLFSLVDIKDFIALFAINYF